MIFAVLRWRPLREGAGEGPPAPWCGEAYAHDVTGRETTERVGGVWDALSELARESIGLIAQVAFPIPTMTETRGGTRTVSGSWRATQHVVREHKTQHIVREFVVRDGTAIEIPHALVSEWDSAASPAMLLCCLRNTSEHLITRAAIACVRDSVRECLDSRVGETSWETVDRHMRTVWDWTFTDAPWSEHVDDAQLALWGLVDNLPKRSREDGNGPSQFEIDTVYDAAFACDIVDRVVPMIDGSQFGVPETFDIASRGSPTDLVERIRAAIRDDYFVALADRAQKETT